mmetsp:Transcript_27683/g.31051  ORF Transcript_27683/g.31051 Transcript_27683/m.31051 type:complete len:317 (-) Transcript_27683:18-968(-)
MGKIFLKRSQATSNGGTSTVKTSTSSTSSNFTNSFRDRGRRRNNHNQQQQQRVKPVQGSEVVAVESQQVNAKTFKYPSGGFETWIEHSLLYTMIRESNIFPPETVLKAIDEEEYTQYFIIKQKQQHHNHQRKINNDNDDYNSDGNKYSTTLAAATATTITATTTAVAAEVSYAQLTALLALAGEEWSSSSEVPQQLCKAISKQIIKYANKHDLDRQQELKELLNPLIDYAKGRGRKQALQMLPWFAALTVSTINPLAFYATYMSMLAANSDSLSKGDRADRNTIDMAEMGSRHGNVEKASLLDEDHYNESDEDNDK